MKPTTRQRAAGAAAFTAIVGGIIYGAVTFDSDRGSVSVPWPDGGVPASVECIETTGIASEAALNLFHLDTNNGRYVYTVLCYDATADAGEEVPLPGGMVALPESQRIVPWDGGMPQFFAALQGEPEVPCACSTGSNCQWLKPLLDGGSVLATAPLGQTFDPGRFAGAGCYKKVCLESGGTSSWPAACPP